MNKGPVTESELIAEATGMRVTLDQLEATIVSEHYFTAADGVCARGDGNDPSEITALPHLRLLTFCVLLLKNGFTVHGVSACADPVNYNQEIGERLAREDAIKKMWPLLGYELKTELAKLYRH